MRIFFIQLVASVVLFLIIIFVLIWSPTCAYCSTTKWNHIVKREWKILLNFMCTLNYEGETDLVTAAKHVQLYIIGSVGHICRLYELYIELQLKWYYRIVNPKSMNLACNYQDRFEQPKLRYSYQALRGMMVCLVSENKIWRVFTHMERFPPYFFIWYGKNCYGIKFTPVIKGVL